MDRYEAEAILRDATGGQQPSIGNALLYTSLGWTFNELSSGAGIGEVRWEDIVDPPATATRWPTWEEVTNRPELDDLPGTLNASKLYGSADITALTVRSPIDLTFLGPFDAPFLLAAGAPEVPNLDANKLGGFQASDFGRLAVGNSWGMAQVFEGAASFQGPFVPFVVAGTDRVDNLHADIFDGQHGAYYLARANHTGTLLLSAIQQGTTGQVLLGVTGAGPAYGQIDNSHILGAAAIAWSKIDKTGSSLANLTTRSAADLSSGTLLDARLSPNVPLKNAQNVFTQPQLFNPAGVIMLRMWNTAGVVDARAWDFRTVLADGTLELRTTSDATATQALIFDVPRAGGFRIRTGGLHIGTTEVLTSARVFQNGTFGGSMRGAAIADADGTLADLTAKFNTLLAQRRTRGDQA